MTNDDYIELRKSAEERSARFQRAVAELEQALKDSHDRLERGVRHDMTVLAVVLTAVCFVSLFVLVTTFMSYQGGYR